MFKNLALVVNETLKSVTKTHLKCSTEMSGLSKIRILAKLQIFTRPFSSKKIPNDGLLVHLAARSYDDYIDITKSSSPIIILHDLLGSKDSYNSVAKQLNRRLGRKVWTVDARNHGDSPRSNHFNYEYLVCDLIYFMRNNDIRRATIVGHSLGGRIGMMLAMRYPNRVRSLVVIDMSPFGVSPNMLGIKKLLRDIKNLYLDRYYTVKEARKQAAAQLREKKYDEVLIKFLLTSMVETEWHTNWMWKFNLDTIIKTYDRDICFFPIVSSPCDVRTLFLAGRNSDYLMPQEEEDIKDLFTRAEFTYIDGAGHFVHVDKPVEFLDSVVAFIDKDPTNLQEELEKYPLGHPVDLAYQQYDEHTDHTKDTIPVVILHGLLGSKQNWNSMAQQINQKTGRKVYALDARNHGDSPHAELFSYEMMVIDLLVFFKLHGITKATIIGHSMGGRTAMLLTLMYPVLVQSLVVVDMSIGKNSPNMLGIKQLLKDIKNLNVDPKLPVKEARMIAATQLKKTIKDERIVAFILTNLIEDKGKRGIRNWRWKFNLDSIMKNIDKEIFAFPFFRTDSPVQTLFVGGANSDYLTPDDEAKNRKFFPRAEFTYIPGAGHWVHAEKPADFLQVVSEFINKDRQ